MVFAEKIKFFILVSILRLRNSTRALQSIPLQNPGGVPWAWRTEKIPVSKKSHPLKKSVSLWVFSDRGGLQCPKPNCCLYWDIFQVKYGGITKVQTLWGSLVGIKSGFKKSSFKDSKKQGGGQGQIEEDKTNKNK